MKQELDEKLCKDFPLLYADRHGKMSETAMCWGFDFDDGWYDITYELSEKLEKEIQKFISKNPDCEYPPRAVQMKEKFGSGRCYMSGETDEMEDIIRKWEHKTSITCELCSKPGELCTAGGWLKTLCPDCVVAFNTTGVDMGWGGPQIRPYVQCSKIKDEE